MSDSTDEASARRFRGSLDDYDRHRPAPPAFLMDLVARAAGIVRPKHVVDLGCGTGLSSRAWAQNAERVTGIDPNPEMLAVARGKAPSNVTHRLGFSHETEIESAGADLVTCCQSLHWMLPEPTIREVARILRPGGAWLIADYELPQISDEIDDAVQNCLRMAKEKSIALGMPKEERKWIGDAAGQIRSSNKFCQVQQFGEAGDLEAFTLRDHGDATRLLGLLRSLGTIQMPLQHCHSDSEIGLNRVDEVARRILADATIEWRWRYHVVLAVK
jgi:ubiquinone/menaquinone biosynthesis C-methylase UbiE